MKEEKERLVLSELVKKGRFFSSLKGGEKKGKEEPSERRNRAYNKLFI